MEASGSGEGVAIDDGADIISVSSSDEDDV
jgi:hypothetical protein